MGIAKFIALDPYAPKATKAELDNLLSRMDGVLDWAINPDDEVAVEYDHDLITDEMIEAGLSGTGLKLKHISDEPDFETNAARRVLDQEENLPEENRQR